MTPILYGYWRSSAAYRLRIALNLKEVEYTQVSVNLRDGDQRSPAHRAVHPQGFVPALQTADGVLIQSPAILEWIEETWPEPALLPDDPLARARVRAYGAVIGCDIHPVQNLRILQHIRAEYGQGDDAVTAWCRRWIADGFQALEAMAAGDGQAGPWLWGDGPGLAEIYLVPQMYNARRFGVDLTPFPRLVAADAAARAVPAFAAAEPEAQPDAPEVGH